MYFVIAGSIGGGWKMKFAGLGFQLHLTPQLRATGHLTPDKSKDACSPVFLADTFE